MALTHIDSVNFMSEMSRKRYSDVGLVELGYKDKYTLYSTSQEILNRVSNYIKAVSTEDSKIYAYVEYTEGKFFWLDSILLKYVIRAEPKDCVITVLINLKESLEYKVLSRIMQADPNLVSSYINYWAACLHYVGKSIGTDLKENEV